MAEPRSYGCLGSVVVASLVTIVPWALYGLVRDEDCVLPAASGAAFLVLTAASLITAVVLLFVKWPPAKGLAGGIAGGYFLGVLLNVMWLSGGC